jgi:hypothetical protein
VGLGSLLYQKLTSYGVRRRQARGPTANVELTAARASVPDRSLRFYLAVIVPFFRATPRRQCGLLSADDQGVYGRLVVCEDLSNSAGIVCSSDPTNSSGILAGFAERTSFASLPAAGSKPGSPLLYSLRRRGRCDGDLLTNSGVDTCCRYLLSSTEV